MFMNSLSSSLPVSAPSASDHTTIEVARMLGLAVRSVQLMVDRGELSAWKTPGGHRRISGESVERLLANRRGETQAPGTPGASQPIMDPAHLSPRRPAVSQKVPSQPRVLLIEDSVHFQNLVSLLVKQQFPQVDLHIASDGIVGLAMVGQLQPDILIVDILLPGIDGATLIASLRTHPQFGRNQLIVVTSLDEIQRAPYAFALAGVPVVHKPDIVSNLPPLLAHCLRQVDAVTAA